MFMCVSIFINNSRCLSEKKSFFFYNFFHCVMTNSWYHYMKDFNSHVFVSVDLLLKARNSSTAISAS